MCDSTQGITVSRYVDTVTLFFENLNQRSLTTRWPLTPSLLRSHVWLYPRITVSKSHENTWKYVDMDKVILFSKTWIKGHWSLDDLWPQVCWSHMCDSTQWSLCPSPMGTHQLMYVDTVISFARLPHTTNIYYVLRTESVVTFSFKLDFKELWTKSSGSCQVRPSLGLNVNSGLNAFVNTGQQDLVTHVGKRNDTPPLSETKGEWHSLCKLGSCLSLNIMPCKYCSLEIIQKNSSGKNDFNKVKMEYIYRTTWRTKWSCKEFHFITVADIDMLIDLLALMLHWFY